MKQVLTDKRSLYVQMDYLNKEQMRKVACQQLGVNYLPDEIVDVLSERCYNNPRKFIKVLSVQSCTF